MKEDPLSFINTSTIFPPDITGYKTHPDPLETVISGSLKKFIISEDPYPTPPSSKCTDVILPLKIGWTLHLKSLSETEEIPIPPKTFTVICG